MDLATKQDIVRITDRKIGEAKDEILEAIERAGQTKYIGLAECASEWGVTKKTASRRLKDTDIEVLWDANPIRVNRKQFYEHLKPTTH